MGRGGGAPVRTRRLGSSRLGLGEDLGDFVDLGEQLVGHGRVVGGLGTTWTAAGKLGGLVEQLMQIGILLEVRGLEVVGPQHPEVVLDQFCALLLDEQGSGAEVGVVVALQLLADCLDRLGLDSGLGRIVDTAGQVAVGRDFDGAGDQAREHAMSFP